MRLCFAFRPWMVALAGLAINELPAGVGGSAHGFARGAGRICERREA